ncbi:MAG TPA: twin-arginine translocase TatA/TatE family subunit [Rhodospirillales bacterium]|nr:twin-arginine translocase TatA/TatE family subunit [Rhodospirillales bacterium]
MGSFSIWHWLIVLAVVLVLFGGKGRLSQIMGDFGKGLRAFKKSVRDDEEPMADADEPARPRALPADHTTVGDPAKDRDRATHP